MGSGLKIQYWFHRVTNDLTRVADAIEYYEEVISDGARHVAPVGNLEQLQAEQPGLIFIFSQAHDDIHAIKKYMETLIEYEEGKEWKRLQSQEGRAEYGDLKATDLKNYVAAADDVHFYKSLLTTLIFYETRLASVATAINTRGFIINSLQDIRKNGLSEVWIDSRKEKLS